MSAAVRETTDGAHRPSPGTNPARHTSVDTATPWSTATHGDTPRDREETARLAENSQIAGRFRRWWPGHRRPARSGHPTACPFPASHRYGPGRSRPPDEIARPNPIRTTNWSRPQGFKYQHGFSPRFGNVGK